VINSPSMNLYEELGLRTSASPQDIRKAHRTLSRLLHPDQQMDADLRQAAELQMRRINAMADILLDPEQRRRYDESLRYVISPPSPAAKPRPATRYPSSVFDLISIAVAAVIITLIAIWLVAGEFIHWKATTSSVVSPPAISRAA
jgi:curved DNA-binding protein CbpA